MVHLFMGGHLFFYYSSFKNAPSLKLQNKKVVSEMPGYITYGIHVVISQHELGKIKFGDSPEYGFTINPFDDHYINKLIIIYLLTYMVLRIFLIG